MPETGVGILVGVGSPVEVGITVGAAGAVSVGAGGVIPQPVKSNESRIKRIVARVINPPMNISRV